MCNEEPGAGVGSTAQFAAHHCTGFTIHTNVMHKSNKINILLLLGLCCQNVCAVSGSFANTKRILTFSDLAK